ncbi:hypothetical protein [Rickettsia endosymbiont of Halotydeus destructor]|uniref:hypothetical protein n=1 Tax=Rickettsia endosymbiont of Halotydeus destructor TaxID=2996754 RepID=UPI003BAF47E1
MGAPIVIDTAVIEPSAHVMAVQKLSNSSPKVEAKLQGQTKAATSKPDNLAKTLYNAGVNLNVKHGMLERGVRL